MKRQRRTLGLLLTWLAVALSAIGVQPRLKSSAESIASAAPARSGCVRGHPPAPDSDAPIVGSLAWIVCDPRHSSGADLVLRLNAENDGLGLAGLDSSAQARGAASSHGLTHVSFDKPIQRLGWSGCTAYSHGCDPWGRPLSISLGRSRSNTLTTIGEDAMAFVTPAFNALQPWLRQLSQWMSAAGVSWARVSLFPGRAAPARVGESGHHTVKLGSRRHFEL
jgi:hypothetical protein